MDKFWWSTKKYYDKQSLCPSDKAQLGSEKNVKKGKRKKQNVANDSFTVKSKAQQTKDNFLLKKPNEQTSYKFEQKNANSRPILEKNGFPETALSYQLAVVEGNIPDKSINLIENSPMVTEKMTQGSSHNTHHVKPQIISSTLSMKKFKKNIKHKASKYQNKITKETVPYVSNEPLHPNDIFLYRSKASSDLTDPQLYFLIKNIYKPHKTFDFPETDRHFRFVWFQEFPWLCYSRLKDGV